MESWQDLQEMSPRYLYNKKIWEAATDKNSPEALAASNENSNIRNIMGIKSDTTSASEFELSMPNTYYDKEQDLVSNNDYQDKYKREADRLYSAIKIFSYNPNTDNTYLAYRDNALKEGYSMQNDTYANMTAMSGGRNNSWASAATAQVGQAYNQKINDAVGVYADMAYNRLLQLYQINNQRGY